MDWQAPLGVLFPPVQGAVLAALWRRPVPMTGREVHRAALAGSYTGVLAALSRLVDQGLVDGQRAGQAVLYRLNADHLTYPALDEALERFHPRADFEVRLKALMTEHLGAGAAAASLAFYGSFARGTAGPDSDIDLLLVVGEGSSASEEQSLVEALAIEGRRWTGNDVHVYAARRDDLARASADNDPIVAEWERDGAVVTGTPIQDLLAGVR